MFDTLLLWRQDRSTVTSERIQRRIERLLDQAEEAADKEDWQLAAAQAKEVLTLDEGNQDALAPLTSHESDQ